MTKYIPADKLIAEIKRRIKENEVLPHRYIRLDEDKQLLSFVTSLQYEQPEVDLEKELDVWRHKHFKGKRDGDYSGEYLMRESQLNLAHHFYELGLKTRKEE